VLGLARYAMKSPMHTGILAALFAVVPLLYVFSAALVALTTLRHGLTAGTRVLSLALTGSLVSWVLSGVPLSLSILVLVALLANVLRATQKWNWTLLFGAVFGLIFAVIAQVLFRDQINQFMVSIQQIFTTGQVDSAQWQLFESIKPMVGYLIAASQLMEALLSLLLARYWQAGLYNPGGLKAEMHCLRFTWQEASMVFGIIVLALLFLPGAALLFGIPFIFVGMALMHGIVAKLKLGGQWLVAIYIGSVLFNQIILPLLILAALADSFFDFRSRITESTDQNNE